MRCLLCLATVALAAALIGGFAVYGCAAAPPSCPDRRAACACHEYVTVSETKCRHCGKLLAGLEAR